MDQNDDEFLNAGNRMKINHWDKTGFPRHLAQYNGTGMVYYCSASNQGDVISNIWDKLIDSGKLHHGPADNYQDRWAKYQLTSIKDLWEKRAWIKQNKIGQAWMYTKDKKGLLDAFYGPSPGDNKEHPSKAHPPWSMPAYSGCLPLPSRKNISEPGEIFVDPLLAYPKHFDFSKQKLPELTNEKYVYHPYDRKSTFYANCINIKSDTSKPLTTAIVFDHSGSMAEERKIDYAREATFSFTPHMKEDDLLSVSIFSNDAQTPQGLELQERNAILDPLHAILPTISPNGGTNIGAGLSNGLEQLCSVPSEKVMKGALLLSDGMNNVGEYNSIVKWYSDFNIPIFTVKFGQHASEQNLKQIAQDTGGTYWPADQITVTNVYTRIFDDINGNSTIIASHDPMSPIGKLAYQVNVTPGADSLHVNTSWQGSKLKTVLTSPSGSAYTGSQLPTQDDRFEEGPISQYTQILNPESGHWKLDISWAEAPSVTERVNLVVSEHTDVYTNILGFSPEYSSGQRVTINAQAAELDGGNNKIPLQNVKVRAKVQIPGLEVIRMIQAQSSNLRVYNDVVQDNILEIELFDDGAHDDYKAGDGIFGGFFTETQKSGSYIVTAHIEGNKANGSGVNCKSVSSFQVGSLHDAKVTTSQIMQYARQLEEKLKTKVVNPLGGMQSSDGASSANSTTPTSGRKRSSHSFMDKLSN